jgi:hypothetical protein
MRSTQRPISAILMAFFCLVSPCSARADFTFAAFGDTPYTEDEEARFVGMIAEINRERPAFSVHVGDFKSGWSPCTDALFVQRRDQFALFHQALIYTPGDNEWSDCWRSWGASRDPLERLQKLRGLFFADGFSLGQQKVALARQSAAYPEHARWTHDGILFATLNVPGGNNNMRMPGEWAVREKALLNWLETTFALARAQGHGAVVVVMQANPFLRSVAVKDGYQALLNALAKESQKFKGEVLLIHGDTHRYRFDQPLLDASSRRRVPNFSRLEVFGYPFVNWVRVHVSRNEGRITFTPSPGG